MMAEQRHPRRNVNPRHSTRILIPLVDAHNITVVHTQSKLEKEGPNLVHCHSNELDQSDIEQARAGRRLPE
jgi:hypothetical protein